MLLNDLNQLPVADAKHRFMQCCTASTWVNNMVAARPFANTPAIKKAADDAWLGLTEQDYFEAFEGHPKIGDVSSLRAKYANTKELAGNEQGLVKEANDAVLDVLAQGNTDYQAKFGFIFIVCATGKSAKQMSDLLQARLPNNRAQELVNAAEEQRKIFQLRITKAFGKSLAED
ncbi:OHCU decarboxylase [Colwellia sp. MT41]|uniref:2-oxo-4-hydroxy-4-carboxy-5-ureidoimidazoline decarboxylase n=1 Tax=Colwellia sp. MT41 TaxID=58049 RepID=UPI000717912A|nr:2-oxo-4-hydroxy-4-carboxy-5-ureidoimidazoline decarboxylase [Colwellia sp. MT41]ALO36340.1 OHCU decarboxylase [Colwellia sp. MT41]